MNAFRDQPFSSRMAGMGDAAEGVFEQVYDQGWVRWGLNRPPINVGALPLKVRYAPDYLTQKGYVEVQGFGRDRQLKLKLEKQRALELWHAEFRVDFFVWDSRRKRYGFARWEELTEACARNATVYDFAEGKPYHSLHVDDVPVVEWVKL